MILVKPNFIPCVINSIKGAEFHVTAFSKDITVQAENIVIPLLPVYNLSLKGVPCVHYNFACCITVSDRILPFIMDGFEFLWQLTQILNYKILKMTYEFCDEHS